MRDNESQERYLHYELFSSAAHSISAVLPAAMVFRPMAWQPGVTSNGWDPRIVSAQQPIHWYIEVYLYIYTISIHV